MHTYPYHDQLELTEALFARSRSSKKFPHSKMSEKLRNISNISILLKIKSEGSRCKMVSSYVLISEIRCAMKIVDLP